MSSQSITRCAVCTALLVCSAWVTVPLGPVPFTLQTLVLALLPQVLSRRDAMAVVVTYVVLGLVGLPVFSSFQGGFSALAGPTGGFIWAFVISMYPSATIMQAEGLPERGRVVLGAVVLLAICYTLGTIQLMLVGNLSVVAALSAAVLPFVIPDALKVAASMVCARAINRLQVA